MAGTGAISTGHRACRAQYRATAALQARVKRCVPEPPMTRRSSSRSAEATSTGPGDPSCTAIRTLTSRGISPSASVNAALDLRDRRLGERRAPQRLARRGHAVGTDGNDGGTALASLRNGVPQRLISAE